MRRLCAGMTAGVLLMGGAWLGGTSTAHAAYQVDRIELCGPGDSHDCSISIRDEVGSLIEGRDAATIDVQGNGSASGSLQMYAVDLEGGGLPDSSSGVIVGFRAYGSPVVYTTNVFGDATVTVPVTRLAAPDDAGSAIVFAFADASLFALQERAVSKVAGSRVGYPDATHVRSARGVLLNESATVTDGVLVAEVGGALTGDEYGLQISYDGAWRKVPSSTGRAVVDSDGSATVTGDLSGYPDEEYDVRPVNATRGLYDLREGTVRVAKDIYITPGEHLKNGRRWRTTCEPYSRTERCRTQIWATTVENQGGRIVKRTGWAFNNLTYKASARTLWRGNPLGNPGSHVIDGRKWRTECDTPATGRNGCRSFIVAKVVESTRSGSGYTYAVVTKEVFNNIVLFSPRG